MNALPPAELEQLATRLRQRRLALVRQLHEHLRQATPRLEATLISGASTLDDPAVTRQLQDCDVLLLAGELAELRRIDGATGRITAGAYGRCERCGCAIALERLRAQPVACMCLSCQEAYEQGPHRPPAE